MDNKKRGNLGEKCAAAYLAAHGYKILETNYSCRMGEIDIIASKGDIVSFVEVKLRKNDSFAAAREFVTPAKQRRIITTAGLWLSENGCELQPRFDVIEIYAPTGIGVLKVKINHIEDAFR